MGRDRCRGRVVWLSCRLDFPRGVVGRESWPCLGLVRRLPSRFSPVPFEKGFGMAVVKLAMSTCAWIRPAFRTLSISLFEIYVCFPRSLWAAFRFVKGFCPFEEMVCHLTVRCVVFWPSLVGCGSHSCMSTAVVSVSGG